MFESGAGLASCKYDDADVLSDRKLDCPVSAALVSECSELVLKNLRHHAKCINPSHNGRFCCPCHRHALICDEPYLTHDCDLYAVLCSRRMCMPLLCLIILIVCPD